MPRGKMPESPALKSAVAVYDGLSEEDKEVFRNKILSKIFKGLDKAARDEYKKEFNNMLARIETAKESAKQLEAVSALSIEELERILEAKKKNQ